MVYCIVVDKIDGTNILSFEKEWQLKYFMMGLLINFLEKNSAKVLEVYKTIKEEKSLGKIAESFNTFSSDNDGSIKILSIHQGEKIF